MTETTESKSAFGSRVGLSRQRVGQLAKRGHVLLDTAGRVRIADSLRKMRDAGRLPDGVEMPREPGEDPFIDTLADRLDRGEILSKAEAEQVKENYLARKRRLDYEREEGSVVEVEAAARVMQQALSQVRTRLLAMPTRVAPRAVNQPKATTVEDLLREEVTDTLEDISRLSAADLLPREP